MTISLRWAEDINNVLIWQFSSDWAWKEVFDTGPHSDALLNTQSGRVDVMMLTAATGIPAGAFDQLDKLARSDLPDNLGLIVIVNATDAAHTMVKISTKMNAISFWKLADS